jgi:hypothetical protein
MTEAERAKCHVCRGTGKRVVIYRTLNGGEAVRTEPCHHKEDSKHG